jgi:hypothetical protein
MVSVGESEFVVYAANQNDHEHAMWIPIGLGHRLPEIFIKHRNVLLGDANLELLIFRGVRKNDVSKSGRL